MTSQVPENLWLDGRVYRLSPFPPLPKASARIVSNPLLKASKWYRDAPDDQRIGRSWWEIAQRNAPRDALRHVLDFIERCSVNPAMNEEISAILNSPEAGFGLSTACRRNYVGTWKIDMECLYLCHLSLFHGRVLSGPEEMRADWITGKFVGGFGAERNSTTAIPR